MKKRFTTLMTTLILSVFFSISASAYDVEVDGIYYNLIKKAKQAEVTSGDNRYTGDIIIPSSIILDEVVYTVTAIASNAFETSGITSIDIPNSVTKMGYGAFMNCKVLKSAKISQSLQLLENYLFNGCTELTDVTIPNSVEKIGDAVFTSCKSIQSIVIPNSVTKIGNAAFGYCSNLSHISLPNTLINIEANAFCDCISLNSITIPTSLANIKHGIFSGCTNLKSIEIPNNIHSVGEYAFAGCSSLEKVIIGTSVSTIYDNAFARCSNLSDFYCMTESMPYAYPNTFKDSYIEYATLHAPESSIGSYQATEPWSRFGTIVKISSDIPEISEIDGISYKININSLAAEVIKSQKSYIGEIVIPSSIRIENTEITVNSIASSAFKDCRELTSVTIGDNITSIGDNAFANCLALTAITFNSYEVPYIGIGVFEGIDKTAVTLTVPTLSIYKYMNASAFSDFDVIKSADGSMIANFQGLKYLINNTLMTAELIAGTNKYLGEIIVPNSITIGSINYNVTSIAAEAFKDCTELTSITIGSNVTSIGDNAFTNCSSLVSLTLQSTSIPLFNASVFINTIKKKISLYVPNTLLTDYLSLETTSEFNSILPLRNDIYQQLSMVKVDGIYYSIIGKGKIAEVIKGYNKYYGDITIPESININESIYEIQGVGNEAFSGCSNLHSVSLPNTIKSIGSQAFYLSSITNISLPSSLNIIKEWAFKGCSNLTSVELPNSINQMGEQIFSECKNLSDVKIHESCTEIAWGMFLNCSSLLSINIPDNVEIINSYAFEGCENLKDIYLSDNLKIIGEKAFNKCCKLTSVTIPQTIREISSKAFSECSSLTNFYCYAENQFKTYDNAFDNSYIEHSTLYVPKKSIALYQTSQPWSKFGTIKAIEGDEDIEQCETPTISYSDGELKFGCSTEGAQYVYDIVASDAASNHKSENGIVSLSAYYDISCYAIAEGYTKSETATAKLYWLPSSGTLEGDNINNVSMRGIAIQSSGGFINISGLDNNEKVNFYGVDGKALGFAKSIDGSVSFSAKQGTIVVAKIGNESVKIAVE